MFTNAKPSAKHSPSFSRRRLLSSALAALTAVAGISSTSCAASRGPGYAGYPLRSFIGGYELQVLVDGWPVRTFDRAGETYVLGTLGARYTLRVVNHTGRRIEAVVSVDGRDAIDGRGADVRNKRGYLVPAWGSVDVEGWRLSHAEVAAFRFATVADSYAARTGTARDVGVIGVAVFPERYVPPPRPIYTPPYSRSYPYPNPYPNPSWPRWYEDRGYGSAPRDKSGMDEQAEAEAPRHSSKSRSAPAPAASAPIADDSLQSREGGAAPSGRAEAEADSGRMAPERRPGLGTEFGEAMSSPVEEVNFVRANAARPSVVLGARYNDRDGLIALGIDVDGDWRRDDDLSWRQSATPFPASDRRYSAPPSGWQDGCCVRY